MFVWSFYNAYGFSAMVFCFLIDSDYPKPERMDDAVVTSSAKCSTSPAG